MTPRLLVIAALLCAVPATGGNVEPTPAQVEALTVVDAPPSPAAIDRAFASGPGSTPGLDAVVALAGDSMQDLGVQIRALRALPQYCLPSCAGTAVHDTLARLAAGYRDRLATGPLSPQDLLRLRTAVEALGATRAGLQSDVDLLTLSPVLLHHPSRDVQVTTIRALRNLCSPELCSPDACRQGASAVRPLLTSADTQLNDAIRRALFDLARCAQP